MTSVSYEDIVDDIPLDEVLDDLGIPVVASTRTGWQNTSCPLPSHPGADTSPSFGINEEYKTWHCFACVASGTLAELVVLLEGLSYDEAVDYLATYAGYDIDSDHEFLDWIDKTLERNGRPKRRVIRKFVPPYFNPQVIEGLPLATVDQFSKWGIREQETIDRFGFRYDEERKFLDYMGPALVIPHYYEGALVGWQERWLDDDRPKEIPKYKMSKDFPAEWTLYDYDEISRESSWTIVVESVMTVARLQEMGYPAVATFGASIAKQQLRLLSGFEEVWLAFDNDSAGQAATKLAVDYLIQTSEVLLLPTPEETKADYADLPDNEILRLIGSRKYAWEVM